MKKSIRISLFLIFAATMASFVVCGVLLNILGLEKYYVLRSGDLFAAVASAVTATLATGGDVQRRLEEIDRAEGISISVADRAFNILYASFPQKKIPERLPKEIEDLIRNTRSNVKRTALYGTVEKREIQPKLAYIIMTADERYIVLTKPIKGIRESTGIANQFYIIAGIIVLAIGSIPVFRFSDKVTKPIVQMSKIAGDISELNFDRKLAIKSEDELGLLAGSINTLSDKLKASVEGLQNDIEFQKSLSRNMSHELKTPIGVIKGYAEGLQFGVADNPDMREKYLQVIINECDRMDDLVKEMLTLSRLTAKDYVLHDISCFQIAALVDAVRERFSHELSECGITLFTQTNGETKLNANYELLLRAVSNLVSNAIKYNDDNKYIRLSAAENESHIIITVYNTCGGIAESELPRIFDVFYKTDKARSREKGGHGLGLSIVKSIAELHGGQIAVQNTKGGIEFTLTVPKKFP